MKPPLTPFQRLLALRLLVPALLLTAAQFAHGALDSPRIDELTGLKGKLNEKGKLSRNAIAEGIINNVRKTIIRNQLTDPRFYAEMSKLLDDLIKQSRADAAAYEAFLKNAEELVGLLPRTSGGRLQKNLCSDHSTRNLSV